MTKTNESSSNSEANPRHKATTTEEKQWLNLKKVTDASYGMMTTWT
jgi:hypothetical protein